jgi:hypothetical protein
MPSTPELEDLRSSFLLTLPQAGAYTRPFLSLNIITCCGTPRLASVCL